MDFYLKPSQASSLFAGGQEVQRDARQTSQGPADKSGAFQEMLFEKLGGGESGWTKVMGLDEPLIEDALAKASSSTGSLHAAADKISHLST